MLDKYRKLNGRMRELGISQDDFARKLGINPTTLSRKLNGSTEFLAGEIQKSCLILKIDPTEIPVYFFA